MGSNVRITSNEAKCTQLEIFIINIIIIIILFFDFVFGFREIRSGQIDAK